MVGSPTLKNAAPGENKIVDWLTDVGVRGAEALSIAVQQGDKTISIPLRKSTIVADAGKDAPDASTTYLTALQRLIVRVPQNTPERRARFCAEWQESLAHMRPARASELTCDYVWSQLPDMPYESTDFSFVRLQLERRIQAGLQTLQIAVPNSPVIGTLPVGLLNARSVLVPHATRPVIILNDQVFRLPYDLIKASLEALEFNSASDGTERVSFDQDQIAANIKAHPDISRHFEFSVLRYLHRTTGAPDDEWANFDSPLNTLKVQLNMGLADSIELFILAHEFAHIILRHDYTKARPLILQSGSGEATSASETAYSWRQEFEADAFGFAILQAALKAEATENKHPIDQDPMYPFKLAGPSYFFLSMAMVEKAQARIETGRDLPDLTENDRKLALAAIESMFDEEKSAPVLAGDVTSAASHPPFMLRALQARFLEDHAREEFFKTARLDPSVQQVYRFSGAFVKALGVLFEQSAGHFAALHTDAATTAVQEPTVPKSITGPNQLSPETVYDELKERGLDLLQPSDTASAVKNAQQIKDTYVIYNFETGNGTVNLVSASLEVQQSAAALSTALSTSGLESRVIVKTKQAGARVKAQLIARASETSFSQLTNDTDETIPIGFYHIWAERAGKPTSSKTDVFRVLKKEMTVELVEEATGGHD